MAALPHEAVSKPLRPVDREGTLEMRRAVGLARSKMSRFAGEAFSLLPRLRRRRDSVLVVDLDVHLRRTEPNHEQTL